MAEIKGPGDEEGYRGRSLCSAGNEGREEGEATAGGLLQSWGLGWGSGWIWRRGERMKIAPLLP